MLTPKEKRAAWREKNRERVRAYDRARYAERPEKVKARAAAWHKAHPERVREQRRKWALKNKEKIRLDSRARYAAGLGHCRRRELGVSKEKFEAMFEEQGRRCAICRTDTDKKWPLDHDHATGRYRAILCTRCNFAIGHLQDDPGRCRVAAGYLEHHQRLHSLL